MVHGVRLVIFIRGVPGGGWLVPVSGRESFGSVITWEPSKELQKLDVTGVPNIHVNINIKCNVRPSN